jgi:hypothetical protein
MLQFLQSGSKFRGIFYSLFHNKRYSLGVYEFPHVLARFGLIEIMMMILEHGATTDCLDGKGRTPLIHAVKYNHLLMVKFLIERGSHVCP